MPRPSLRLQPGFLREHPPGSPSAAPSPLRSWDPFQGLDHATPLPEGLQEPQLWFECGPKSTRHAGGAWVSIRPRSPPPGACHLGSGRVGKASWPSGSPALGALSLTSAMPDASTLKWDSPASVTEVAGRGHAASVTAAHMDSDSHHLSRHMPARVRHGSCCLSARGPVSAPLHLLDTSSCCPQGLGRFSSLVPPESLSWLEQV